MDWTVIIAVGREMKEWAFDPNHSLSELNGDGLLLSRVIEDRRVSSNESGSGQVCLLSSGDHHPFIWYVDSEGTYE